MRLREIRDGYLCISLWIIGFVVFTAGPMFASLALSLTRYDILAPPSFIGLNNYVEMFANDELFWTSLRVTTVYTIILVPLGVICGYLISLLLNQTVLGLSFFRTVFYLPVVVPAIATSYLFAWMFHSEIGLINSFLAYFGIEGPSWFFSREWVMPAFVIMALWGLGAGHGPVPGRPSGRANSTVRGRNAGRSQPIGQAVAHHGADDFPGNIFHFHHRFDRHFPGLHPCLRHNGGRPGQSVAVLYTVSLSKRLAIPGDGLRFGHGLGALCNHLWSYPPEFPSSSTQGVLRGPNQMSTRSVNTHIAARRPGQAGFFRQVRWRRLSGSVVIYGLLLVLGAAFALPFVWLATTSLKTEANAYVIPPNLIPNPLIWENYQVAIFGFPLLRSTAITMYILVGAMVGTILTASLTAFGFARLRFPGRDVLFVLVLSTMMIPYYVELIPQYLLFRMIGWVDTPLPLIVPGLLRRRGLLHLPSAPVLYEHSAGVRRLSTDRRMRDLRYLLADHPAVVAAGDGSGSDLHLYEPLERLHRSIDLSEQAGEPAVGGGFRNLGADGPRWRLCRSCPVGTYDGRRHADDHTAYRDLLLCPALLHPGA